MDSSAKKNLRTYLRYDISLENQQSIGPKMTLLTSQVLYKEQYMDRYVLYILYIYSAPPLRKEKTPCHVIIKMDYQ